MATAALTLMLFLAGVAAAWTITQRQPETGTPPRTTAAQTASPPAALPPREDVAGEEVPDLPRPPDSIRAGYERGERNGLVTIRARYLTTEGLDAVRGFYRGVFQAEGWTEADAGFSSGEWNFHVTDGEREATVRISSIGPSVETVIELSEPLPEEPAPESTGAPEPVPDEPVAPTPEPPQYEPAPAPSTPPANPQYAVPAPAPIPGDDFDDDDFEDDDDFGDD